MSVTTACLIAALACNAATGLVLTRILVDLRDLRKAWVRVEASDLDHGLRLTVVEKQIKDMCTGTRELSRTVGMIDLDVRDLMSDACPGSDDDHEARCLGCRACMRGDCN